MIEVDAKGLKCPMPIIRLGAAVRSAGSGGEVRVVADDKGFAPDVRAWVEKTGNVLVSLDDHDPANIVAVVRKS